MKELMILTQSSTQHLIACYRDREKQDALDVMIKQLLQKQCVCKMSVTEFGFLSRVFLVSKKKWRLIIDQSKMNEILTPVTFQVDTLVSQISRGTTCTPHISICRMRTITTAWISLLGKNVQALQWWLYKSNWEVKVQFQVSPGFSVVAFRGSRIRVEIITVLIKLQLLQFQLQCV